MKFIKLNSELSFMELIVELKFYGAESRIQILWILM